MDKIKELIVKYREVITYLIFGVLTTLVNYIAYLIFAKAINIDYLVSTVISQIIAMTFAYITNKIFVFKTKNLTSKQLIKEIVSFFSVRVLSLFLDMLLMYIFVDLLHLDDTIMKLVSNVIIVIVNYICSKLFIFKKKSE